MTPIRKYCDPDWKLGCYGRKVIRVGSSGVMEDTTASTETAGLVEDAPASAGPANGLGDRQPRVLIVDDSLTVRMDLRQIFKAGEFDVDRKSTRLNSSHL